MNFKKISTILTIFSVNLLALSSPLQSKKYSADVADISIDGVDNSQHATYDIYSMDKAEAIDISSDEEVNLMGTDDVKEILDIDSSDETEIETEIETDIETEIEDGNEHENICNTKECVEVANNILNSIDNTVDPCDDFYQFTCGNYIKNHPVNEEDWIIKSFDSAEPENRERIINMLQNDYKPNKNLSKQDQENDKLLFNQLKNLYQSCMDVDTINKKGVKPMVDLLKKLQINEKKDKYNDPNELGVILAKLHNVERKNRSFTYNSLFNMNSLINDDGMIILSLGKTEGIIDDEEDSALRILLSNIFKDSEERNIDKMVDSVVEFEKKLFEESNEEEVDPYEVVDIKTLNEKYPNINWKTYLEEKFDSFGMKEKISNDTPVYNSDIAYIKNLNKILSEVDGETLSNYFEMVIIYNCMGLLSTEFIPEDFKEIKSETNRTDYCYDIISRYLPDHVSRYFAKIYFNPSKKQYAKKVVEYIRQSMINRITNVEWLDDETREYAAKKVAAINKLVGIDDSKNLETLFNNFQNLTTTEDDYFNNVIKINEINNNYSLKNIQSSKDDILESLISLPQQTINAKYYTGTNSVNIPAGILQLPFFSIGIPDYINYGGIGTIIGHEFTHAFDNTGRKYDIKGNDVNWWTQSDSEEYDEKATCFVNQYNKLYMEDKEGQKHYVFGTITLDENIADNGGLIRAYESWQLSLLEDSETVKKENQKLPGLTQYTADQLFFISFGNIWCENIYNDYLEVILYSDHSPGNARVNGAVSNFKIFAKTFNCPINSKMNPKYKC
jgi:endothelin-converting enzyme/membrane metallo-endopeptidase-like protein 1